MFSSKFTHFTAALVARLPHYRERLYQYALLARFHRPIGALLLLWPTMWALWIAAEGVPAFSLIFIFFAGVFVMRGAGCVMNDIADREFDRYVERTRERPLVTGAVSLREAGILIVSMLAIALILVSFLNALALKLAFVGLLLAISYPFIKRVTYMPQFYLGLAFGWGIPMAFAAQTDTVPGVAWLLFLANILWTVVYDTLYAMVDRDDDIRIGVKSTAILFGDDDRSFLALFQGLFLLAMLFVGSRADLGLIYHVSILFVGLLFAYQQMLIKEREREECFNAFLNNNWVGVSLFAGLVLDYWVT